MQDVDGTPTGPVSLWHSISDIDVDQLPSDFEATGYTDTLLDRVQPTDTGGQYYELDVTDLVLADYAVDGDIPLSAFRLQVNDAVFLEDNQSHQYEFAMPGAGTRPPELLLAFVPEPSTLFLATLGLLGLLAHARQRNAA